MTHVHQAVSNAVDLALLVGIALRLARELAKFDLSCWVPNMHFVPCPKRDICCCMARTDWRRCRVQARMGQCWYIHHEVAVWRVFVAISFMKSFRDLRS